MFHLVVCLVDWCLAWEAVCIAGNGVTDHLQYAVQNHMRRDMHIPLGILVHIFCACMYTHIPICINFSLHEMLSCISSALVKLFDFQVIAKVV